MNCFRYCSFSRWCYKSRYFFYSFSVFFVITCKVFYWKTIFINKLIFLIASNFFVKRGFGSSLFILLLCCLSLNFSAIQLSNIDLHKSQSWRIAKWKTYHGRSWSCWGSLVGRLFGVWKPCWILSTQYLYMFIAGKICFVRTMRRKGTECWGECLHVYDISDFKVHDL